MKLYHATTQANASLIEVHGAIPRQDKGNWYSHPESVPSIENFVYLANDKNHLLDFHGLRSCMVNKEDSYSIVEFDVDVNNLYPDENLWIEGTVYRDEMLSAQSKVLENKGLYEESLKKKGAVAHLGAIQPGRIVNIQNYSLEENKFWGWVKDFKNRDIALFDIAFSLHLDIQELHKHDLKELVVKTGMDNVKSIFVSCYNSPSDHIMELLVDSTIDFSKWL